MPTPPKNFLLAIEGFITSVWLKFLNDLLYWLYKHTIQGGKATLVAGTVNITLSEPELNTNYHVMVTSDTAGEAYTISGATTKQFTINSTNPASTANVKWILFRNF